jgi:hypothetical protein
MNQTRSSELESLIDHTIDAVRDLVTQVEIEMFFLDADLRAGRLDLQGAKQHAYLARVRSLFADVTRSVTTMPRLGSLT